MSHAINVPTGFALEHNIDDMGFVLKAVTTIQRLLGPLSSSAVFATGWSNGGFLATALGMMKDTPFKGVAPISGYQYSGFKEVPHVMPIFMHHSRWAIAVYETMLRVEYIFEYMFLHLSHDIVDNKQSTIKPRSWIQKANFAYVGFANDFARIKAKQDSVHFFWYTLVTDSNMKQTKASLFPINMLG